MKRHLGYIWEGFKSVAPWVLLIAALVAFWSVMVLANSTVAWAVLAVAAAVFVLWMVGEDAVTTREYRQQRDDAARRRHERRILAELERMGDAR